MAKEQRIHFITKSTVLDNSNDCEEWKNQQDWLPNWIWMKGKGSVMTGFELGLLEVRPQKQESQEGKLRMTKRLFWPCGMGEVALPSGTKEETAPPPEPVFWACGGNGHQPLNSLSGHSSLSWTLTRVHYRIALSVHFLPVESQKSASLPLFCPGPVPSRPEWHSFYCDGWLHLQVTCQISVANVCPDIQEFSPEHAVILLQHG